MRQLIGILSIVGFLAINAKCLNTDISECVSYYNQHRVAFRSIAANYGMDAAEVAAVALPEVSRYTGWQNQLESAALHHYYISDGKEGADFSIGYFQMKPSFIEDLECGIVEDEGLCRRFGHLLPSGESETERRRFRLEQLKQPLAPFHYLCAFHAVMSKRFPCLDDEGQRLRFFATAYNFGHTRPTEQIERWMDVGAFPYGSRFKFQQDRYGDVAIAIFQAIRQDICLY